MQVRLETLKPASIAYLRYIGPYGEPVGEFWMRTFAPWLEANDLLANAKYGISHDDPGMVDPIKCRYDACVEVPAGLELSGGVQRGSLPGGRYAVMDFTGNPSTIGDAWSSLLRDWLPTSGYQMDNRPCFEYYPPDESADQDQQEFTCKICIPVRGD
jgi:AraC family transcriptional regulator